MQKKQEGQKEDRQIPILKWNQIPVCKCSPTKKLRSLDPESNRGPTDNRFFNYSLPLYQLSYQENNISSMGLEPTTLGLLDPRSNQLSYEDDMPQ